MTQLERNPDFSLQIFETMIYRTIEFLSVFGEEFTNNSDENGSISIKKPQKLFTPISYSFLNLFAANRYVTNHIKLPKSPMD